MSLSLLLAWRMCRRRWVLWFALALGGGLAVATQLTALQIGHLLTDAAIPGTAGSRGHQVLCWAVREEPARCRFSFTEVDALQRSDVAAHLTFFAVTPASIAAADGTPASATLVVADALLGTKLDWAAERERWPLETLDAERPGAYLLASAEGQAVPDSLQLNGHAIDIAGSANGFGRLFERAARPVLLTTVSAARVLRVGLSDEMPVWQVVALPGRQGEGAEQIRLRAQRVLEPFRSAGSTLHLAGPLHVDPRIAARAARLQRLAAGIGWVESAGILFGLFCASVLVWLASTHSRFVMFTLGGGRRQMLAPQLWSVLFLGAGGLIVGMGLAPFISHTFFSLIVVGSPGSDLDRMSWSAAAAAGLRIGAGYLAGIIVVAVFAVLVLSKWSSAGMRLQQRIVRLLLGGFVGATVLAVVVCFSLARTLAGLQADAANFSFRGLMVYSLEYGPSKSLFPAERRNHEAFARLTAALSTRRVSASLAGSLSPLTGWYDEDGILTRDDGSEARVKVARVSERHFETIGLRLAAGSLPRHAFDGNGQPATPSEVVINTRLMRLLGWSDPRSAIGRTLHLGTLDSWDSLDPGATTLPAIRRTIVAVVDEGSSGSAGASALNPMVKDLPPLVYLVDLRMAKTLLFADATIPVATVLDEVHRLAGSSWDRVDIGWIRSGEEIEDSILRPDRSAFQVAAFASFALVLSMAVLVVAFLRVWIDSRTKTLAVQFALGATPANVIRQAGGQLVLPVLVGVVLGSVALMLVPPLSGGAISPAPAALVMDLLSGVGIVVLLLGAIVLPTLWRLGRSNFAEALKSL